MTANISSFYPNFPPDKKTAEVVEKDIRKWVESVVEFKANLDKQKNEVLPENNLKKVKKFKAKKKPSLVTVPMSTKISSARKNLKTKKNVVKRPVKVEKTEKKKPESSQAPDPFNEIKDTYRTIKLPQNWTCGMSGGRIVFNRIKVTAQNSQQKVMVERSLVITKDRNVHVLVHGSEIVLNNWEFQKVENCEDIKKAIKEVDALKICQGPANGPKSTHCTIIVDGKSKTCSACKTETPEAQKEVKKKIKGTKKAGGTKGIIKEKSFQKPN